MTMRPLPKQNELNRLNKAISEFYHDLCVQLGISESVLTSFMPSLRSVMAVVKKTSAITPLLANRQFTLQFTNWKGRNALFKSWKGT